MKNIKLRAAHVNITHINIKNNIPQSLFSDDDLQIGVPEARATLYEGK